MFDMKEMKSFLASESAGLGGGIASWHSLIDMIGVVITVSTPELFREGLSNNICMFQSKANIHTISVHCMDSNNEKRNLLEEGPQNRQVFRKTKSSTSLNKL